MSSEAFPRPSLPSHKEDHVPPLPFLNVSLHRRRPSERACPLASPVSLRPRSSSGGSSGPTSSVLDLYVGQCIQNPGVDSITDVENAVCTNEHWGEVFHVMTITSSQMPSEDDMDDMAWDACVDAFDAYVGRPYDDSTWTSGGSGRPRESWAGRGSHHPVHRDPHGRRPPRSAGAQFGPLSRLRPRRDDPEARVAARHDPGHLPFTVRYLDCYSGNSMATGTTLGPRRRS